MRINKLIFDKNMYELNLIGKYAKIEVEKYFSKFPDFDNEEYTFDNYSDNKSTLEIIIKGVFKLNDKKLYIFAINPNQDFKDKRINHSYVSGSTGIVDEIDRSQALSWLFCIDTSKVIFKK